MTSYKDIAVRAAFHGGRFVVESRIGETWHTVAVRERPDTASAIAIGLRSLLEANQDDPLFQREQEERDRRNEHG